MLRIQAGADATGAAGQETGTAVAERPVAARAVEAAAAATTVAAGRAADECPCGAATAGRAAGAAEAGTGAIDVIAASRAARPRLARPTRPACRSRPAGADRSAAAAACGLEQGVGGRVEDETAAAAAAGATILAGTHAADQDLKLVAGGESERTLDFGSCAAGIAGCNTAAGRADRGDDVGARGGDRKGIDLAVFAEHPSGRAPPGSRGCADHHIVETDVVLSLVSVERDCGCRRGRGEIQRLGCPGIAQSGRVDVIERRRHRPRRDADTNRIDRRLCEVAVGDQVGPCRTVAGLHQRNVIQTDIIVALHALNGDCR